jgi:hypothetical protein
MHAVVGQPTRRIPMKLSVRIVVQVVAAALLCLALAGTARATPPLCSDICTLSTPCSQICWGPGPGGMGAVITCRKWGHTCSGVQDDGAVATCERAPTADTHRAPIAPTGTWLDRLAADWGVA